MEAVCPQCGRGYLYMAGMVLTTLYTDPGYCSIECAQSRLLYLLSLHAQREDARGP